MRHAFLVLPLLALPLTAGFPMSAPAQEPKPKTMTVRWYGQSFFQVEDSAGRTFAIDPHAIPAFGRVPVKADWVIVSHPHDDHSLVEMIDTGKKDARIAEADVYRGVTETKTGKQDWKVIDAKRGNIRIRNVATYHDTTNGLQRGKNSIFIVEVDGLFICHLGDLGHELTDAQVKAIGKVDVLMVPIGGIYTINGEQAQAVMKQLKPVLDEDIVWFAYYNQEPVGFFIMIPELNQIFKHLKGQLNWLGKIKFLYHKLMGTCKKMFGFAFGIIPEFQGRGLEGAIVMAAAKKVQPMKKYTDFEMNWIGSFNPKMIKICESVGSTVIKTHHTYRYLFDPTKPFHRAAMID